VRSDPSEYEMVVPKDLDSVLETLDQSPGLWTPIAGGTELMVQFGAGLLNKRRFLSIWNLAELRRIEVSPEWLSIGAGSTFSDLRKHKTVLQEFALLTQTASWSGSIANQNRGTLGGNIVNGSPAADTPPALLAYGAEIEVISLSGSRRLDYSSFHLGYKQVDLAPNELVLALHLPRGNQGCFHYVRKVGARSAQAISKVALAGVGRLKDGVVEHIRIGAASLAPIPLRCFKTERYLAGRTLSEQTIREAKACFIEESSPIDDIRSTAEYRAQVGANLLEEFLIGLKEHRT